MNIPNSTFQRHPLLKPVFQCQVYRKEERNNERQTVSVSYLLKKLPHFTFNGSDLSHHYIQETVCFPDFTVNQWDEKLLHREEGEKDLRGHNNLYHSLTTPGIPMEGQQH